MSALWQFAFVVHIVRSSYTVRTVQITDILLFSNLYGVLYTTAVLVFHQNVDADYTATGN